MYVSAFSLNRNKSKTMSFITSHYLVHQTTVMISLFWSDI
jgi:hypothetical protein